MDCSTSSFHVLHCILEFAQTHVHGINNAIQPPHPLPFPSPPVFFLSKNQGLSQWVSSPYQMQSIGASASVLPMNIQGKFPLGLTGLISLLSKGLSRVEHHSLKAPILWCLDFGTLKSWAPQFESINSLVFRLLYGPTLISICDYWKNHSFDYITFVSKVMSLLFKTLSRFVIAFLPRSMYLLISCLQSNRTSQTQHV